MVCLLYTSVFYNLDPVEVNIDGDSIDLEMRIQEGPQASINKVRINGNDRLYENVVRRELRTRPGDLFSKDVYKRQSINTGMCLILALSYSSKWELTEAVKQIATKVQDGKLAIENIDDKVISANLSTHFMPDPDLLIRTGGEIRLSNYLLWQCAYSELYFCDTF